MASHMPRTAIRIILTIIAVFSGIALLDLIVVAAGAPNDPVTVFFAAIEFPAIIAGIVYTVHHPDTMTARRLLWSTAGILAAIGVIVVIYRAVHGT